MWGKTWIKGKIKRKYCRKTHIPYDNHIVNTLVWYFYSLISMLIECQMKNQTHSLFRKGKRKVIFNECREARYMIYTEKKYKLYWKEKKQDFHRWSVYMGLIIVQIIKVLTIVSYLQTLRSISLDIRRRKHHLC